MEKFCPDDYGFLVFKLSAGFGGDRVCDSGMYIRR
jgi:hypothetical protein